MNGEKETGRMAVAMIKYSKDVLPAPDRLWVAGDATSSRMGGDGCGKRVSSSGMLK
jgi:hypothetical protein